MSARQNAEMLEKIRTSKCLIFSYFIFKTGSVFLTTNLAQMEPQNQCSPGLISLKWNLKLKVSLLFTSDKTLLVFNQFPNSKRCTTYHNSAVAPFSASDCTIFSSASDVSGLE